MLPGTVLYSTGDHHLPQQAFLLTYSTWNAYENNARALQKNCSLQVTLRYVTLRRKMIFSGTVAIKLG